MAAFTSKAAGNWSASGQTTWNEVGVPGNGDTVTITHAITVDAATTVGTSGATGTAAVTINSGGTVTVAAGVTWTVRGDILTATAASGVVDVVTLSAGAVLEFDASAAASPSTTLYVCRLGNGAAHRARFKTNGTSGSRCTVRSNAGGGNGRFTLTGSNTGFFDCTYTDFTRIGDASNAMLQADIATNNANSRFVFTNCVFDACGSISTSAGGTPGAAAVIQWEYNRTKNTAGGGITFGTNNTATGTRSIQFSSFDKQVNITYGPWTIQDNVFLVAMNWSGTASNYHTSFRRNLLRTTVATAAAAPAGIVYDSYILADHALANPRFLTYLAGTGTAGATVDGVIFEYTGTDANGDCMPMPGATGATTYTIVRCIVLPNGAGTQSGNLVSALGGLNITIVAEHNTVCSTGTTAGVTVGETYAGHTGMVSSNRSNIFWNGTGSTGYKMYRDVAGNAVQDIASPANANYNCGYNLAAGNNLKGYHASNNTTAMFTSSPGANDVDVNPQFVDSARKLATWDTSLGGPGTVANALAELAKMNDTGYNTAYNIPDLLTYIRGGFAPTNASLQNAGHDGVTIGAVEGVGGGASNPGSGGVDTPRRPGWRRWGRILGCVALILLA